MTHSAVSAADECTGSVAEKGDAPCQVNMEPDQGFIYIYIHTHVYIYIYIYIFIRICMWRLFSSFKGPLAEGILKGKVAESPEIHSNPQVKGP